MRTRFLALLALPAGLLAQSKAPAAATKAYDPTVYSDGAKTRNVFKALRWRLVGPFRGGRSVAVTGDPTKPLVFYFGAVNGGVWKTTNAGQSWDNITDGKTDLSSVGAVAVAPSDPNVIYAGSGEGQPREDLTPGTGVYRSTDGGQTWQHLGLESTHQITAIRVDPKDPDRVFVSALGHAFGPNADRGIFRTLDGGKTWKKVLFVNDSTGAADLSMDVNNPRILYAALWKFQRTPWGMDAGSGRSGMWKTVDGGDTWTELTFNPGMPKGPIGKIGVAVSPANSRRVYANIEARDSLGGVFRSDDAGATWSRVNGDQTFVVRPFYYMSITADPTNENVVYVMNLGTHRSIDGGRTFQRLRVPHGDTHQTWVDPHDSNRLINANDGGASISMDYGRTWSTQDNQPTAQFYHVITDDQWPYRIYGAQQDNTTVSIASRSDNGGITIRDWWPVAGCENAHIAIDPRKPTVTYGGCYMGALSRHDSKTGASRDVSITMRNYDGWAAGDVPERFQWTFPIVISKHDPNIMYATSQHVWRTKNEGQSWEKISGDLTRHDPKTLQRSGGPVSGDMTGTEWYATIYAFNESPKDAKVLWAGSDDGLLHVSRDGGTTWQNVTPAAMKPFTRITEIEPSPHDPAVAYVSSTRYQHDDFAPYFWKTADYGKTWTAINNGIGATSYSRSLREDPVRRGLLFAATETGVYASFDDGANWESMQLNLPRVSVRDLRIKGNDLIAATHGRAFWAIDDISYLRQVADSVTSKKAHLFTPSAAQRFAGGGGGRRGLAGENPRVGAYIDYWLKEKQPGEVKIEILDPAGAKIDTYSSNKPRKADSTGHPAADSAAAAARAARESVDSLSYVPGENPSARAGANRWIWDFQYPKPRVVAELEDDGTNQGPMAPPGEYTARLIVGKDTLAKKFRIVPDPRLNTTQADYEAQFTLAKKVADQINALTDGEERIRDIEAQVAERKAKSGGLPEADNVGKKATELRGKFEAVRAELYEVYTKADQATLNYPIKLFQMFLTLNAQVQEGDSKPTDQHGQIFNDLSGKLRVQLDALAKLEATDLVAFNELLKKAGLPAVYVQAKKPIM